MLFELWTLWIYTNDTSVHSDFFILIDCWLQKENAENKLEVIAVANRRSTRTTNFISTDRLTETKKS
jgi:hypothetical protein